MSAKIDTRKKSKRHDSRLYSSTSLCATDAVGVQLRQDAVLDTAFRRASKVGVTKSSSIECGCERPKSRCWVIEDSWQLWSSAKVAARPL
jgi:hypothetical protein